MKIIDNINDLLGDDLKHSLAPGAKLKIAASCFSIYAYEALKKQLEKIDSLEFIFTAPTFVEHEVADKIQKERRDRAPQVLIRNFPKKTITINQRKCTDHD